MKKLSIAVILVAIGFATFMTGCEDEASTPIGPTLRLFGDGDYIDSDATVEPGSVIKFSWLATKGDVNLKSFNIMVDNLNVQGYPNDDVPNDSYTDSVSLEAPANEGAYTYMFIASDRKELADSVSLSITVEKLFDPITIYSDVVIDVAPGSGNVLANNCASVDGTTFTYNEGTADVTLQQKADLVYFYSGGTATGGGSAVIAAPNDVDVLDGYSDWTTKNATQFYAVDVTTVQFDAMEDDEMILDKVTGTATSRASDLAVDDVVGFETVTGKKGMFKVTALVPGWGTSGGQSITISIKVQQTPAE